DMSGLARILSMVTVTIVFAFVCAGCGSGADSPQPTDATPVAHSPDHDHGHHHEAPHGGVLIALGDHVAHIELVFDAENGALTAYVLDGEAENAVRLSVPELEIVVQPETGDPFSLRLEAYANVLTGETVGETSEFRGQSDELKQLVRFHGSIPYLTVRGVEFRDIHFRFPDGNEE
ncbi:MAG: hypothetical protein KJ060_22585, partial [Candidatus Hydrogenedentes bacterium]|nr:hypothetical protein [Candidatus Hydrogenedentota bacterium]